MRPLPTAFLLLAWADTADRAGDLIPTEPRLGPLRVALHGVGLAVDNQIAMAQVERLLANDNAEALEICHRDAKVFGGRLRK